MELNGFQIAHCVYSDPDADPHPERYALIPSIQAPRQWSLSRFRWIDQSQEVKQILEALEKIFTSDDDIPSVNRHDDHPFR
ncbi:hypothetical protein [Cyanobium sp. N.Huapi 1H5]|uniref:hypothetical protein n=1 Tax=Cyanobium sp. N.Huapi 1H5 TaxID=2823719 RepID=UPI0020CEE433|nr:hypothetical protein [Cyanobium sp. N.Huapi 1H5]